ncbi:MAG: MarR family transcriptional regulator, partial [Anaerolineae bacterium]|nr:MarR family transcriptional regulator [Anaerolineae bacterium]
MTHEDYDLRQTTLELRFLVAAVTKTIGRAMQDRLAKSGHAITPVQLGLMRTTLSGPQTISEASKLMMMDPSTLVPVVDALEARGMVERRKDPADRRRVPIHLTASGRQMLASMMDLHDGDSLMEALAHMGPDGALQLRDLLR